MAEDSEADEEVAADRPGGEEEEGMEDEDGPLGAGTVPLYCTFDLCQPRKMEH